MKYYVYIIQGVDKSYYTGITNNLQERLVRHNTDRGAKYLKDKKPFHLVYFEETADLKSAMKREKQIKDYSRLKKEKLINEFKSLDS